MDWYNVSDILLEVPLVNSGSLSRLILNYFLILRKPIECKIPYKEPNELLFSYYIIKGKVLRCLSVVKYGIIPQAVSL